MSQFGPPDNRYDGYPPQPGYGPPSGPQYGHLSGPQYGYQPPAPPPAPEPKNGLGLAALIVAGVGCLFGLVPLTFWIAGPMALTAIALGFAAWGRVRRGTATNTVTTTFGLVFGVIAAALSIWGAITFFGAMSDLSDKLSPNTRISQELGDIGQCFKDHQGDEAAQSQCIKH